MRDNQEYNGWTNYATWRVRLELFDGWDTSGDDVTANSIQSIAEDYIEFNGWGLARNYALAFLDDVNWNEIAESINENMNYRMVSS
jgi:hypothetical protein|tara:strand:- start:83 stop:340 length:258 start_codon:yes stop_codon:yes gene_type:complete